MKDNIRCLRQENNLNWNILIRGKNHFNIPERNWDNLPKERELNANYGDGSFRALNSSKFGVEFFSIVFLAMNLKLWDNVRERKKMKIIHNKDALWIISLGFTWWVRQFMSLFSIVVVTNLVYTRQFKKWYFESTKLVLLVVLLESVQLSRISMISAILVYC